jgi:hypothetical protein
MAWLGFGSAWGMVRPLDKIWGTYQCFAEKDRAYSPIHGAVAWETGTIRRIFDLGPMVLVSDLERYVAKQIEAGDGKLQADADRLKMLMDKGIKLQKEAEDLGKDSRTTAAGIKKQKEVATNQETFEQLKASVEKLRLALAKKRESLEDMRGADRRKRGRTIYQVMDRYLKTTKTPAAVRLVHTLFHRVDPEASAVTDFKVTNFLSEEECSQSVIALFVAKLLCALDDKDARQRAEKCAAVKAWVSKLAKETGRQEEEEAPKEAKESKASVVVLQPIVGGILKKAVDLAQEGYAESAEKEAMAATEMKDVKVSEEEAKKAQAMEQRGIGLFPSWTINLILLGLLYTRTGLSEEALDVYFKELADHGIKIAQRTGYKEKAGPEALVLSDVKDAASLDNNYEACVYRLLFSKYPTEEQFARGVHLAVCEDKSFKILKNTYSNCMENVLRMVCNYCAFDPKTHALSVEKLRERAAGGVLRFCVALFYDTDVSMLSNIGENPDEKINVHDIWSAVVNSIPYVSYTQRSDSADPEARGFYINIPQDDQEDKKLAEYLNVGGYTVIGDAKPAVYTYNMRPSVRNLIIALDWLLNLNLFGESLAQEFLRDDFVKVYLPKLCNKLDLTLDEKIALDTIDQRDQKGAEEISLNLGFANRVDSITIKTWRGHGSYSLNNISEQKQLPPVLQAPTDYNALPLSALLLQFNIQPFFDKVLALQSPQLQYLSIFTLPYIYDTNTYTDKFFGRMAPNITSEATAAFLEYCMLRNPDRAEGCRKVGRLWAALLRKGGPSEALKQRMAMAIANAKMSELRVAFGPKALLAHYKALVEKGAEIAEIKEAMAVAAEMMKDFATQKAGIELYKAIGAHYKALVEKGAEIAKIKEAMAVAAEMMKDYGTQAAALELYKAIVAHYKALVEKGAEIAKIKEAQAVAAEMMEGYGTQAAALELYKALGAHYKALVEKGAEIAKIKGAQAVAAAMMKDFDTQEAGIELYKALWNRGEGIEEAIAVAAEMIEIDGTGCTASRLYKALIESGYGIKAATVVAAREIKNDKTRFFAATLYQALVEKGVEINAAKVVAAELTKRWDRTGGAAFMSLCLYGALVNKNEAIEEAKRAAVKYITSSNRLIRDRAQILQAAIAQAEKRMEEQKKAKTEEKKEATEEKRVEVKKEAEQKDVAKQVERKEVNEEPKEAKEEKKQ